MDLHFTRWWFALACLCIALATARIAGKLLGVTQPPSHNLALDGLRGYLAFGVLLHHSAVWHVFLTTGKWALPSSAMYAGLGHICVTIFFMITGHLFIGKLLDARKRPIDWSMLYVSRFLRIVPLYVIAISVLLVCAGALTHWQLRESPTALFEHIVGWLAFTFAGTPNVNQLPDTALLMARVTWTLAYEWMFYLSLPLIALVLRLPVRPAIWMIAAGMLALAAAHTDDLFFPIAFPIGGMVSVISRTPLKKAFESHAAAVVALLMIWLVLFVPNLRFTNVMMGLAFCCVACGNTWFGLLSNRAALDLGDVSYAVYLIHGLALAITFRFIVGMPQAASLDPQSYWALIAAIGMAVVCLATLSYRFVEMPCLRRTRQVDAILSRLLVRTRTAVRIS